MPDPRDGRYQKLLAAQLAMNEQTWRILQGRGSTPESQVRLDFAFRAPTRAAAEGLKS